MSLDVLVPIILCIVIAGVVAAACFKEDSALNSTRLNGKPDYPNDTESLLFVWIDVGHGEKGLSLGFAKSINLRNYNLP